MRARRDKKNRPVFEFVKRRDYGGDSSRFLTLNISCSQRV